MTMCLTGYTIWGGNYLSSLYNSSHHPYLWASKAEIMLQNQSSDDLSPSTFEKLRLEVYQMLDDRQQKMLQSLQSYFESRSESLHLVEKYREDFI